MPDEPTPLIVRLPYASKVQLYLLDEERRDEDDGRVPVTLLLQPDGTVTWREGE